MSDREVDGAGASGDVGVSGGVDGDGVAVVAGSIGAAAAEIGGIGEGGADWAQLGDKGVGDALETGEGRLKSRCGGGEVGGECVPGAVGVAAGIDSDGLCDVSTGCLGALIAAAAEIGGVNERAAAANQAGDECGRRAGSCRGIGRLVCAAGDGKVSGVSGAGDVGIVVSVQGNGV